MDLSFNIAYALQVHRVRYECIKCGWSIKTNPNRKPVKCPLCNGDVEEKNEPVVFIQ